MSSNNQEFLFSKKNFILLAISIVLIIVGFSLISGGKSSEETGFDPKIFNYRRLLIGPIVLILGFSSVIYAILNKTQHKEKNSNK